MKSMMRMLVLGFCLFSMAGIASAQKVAHVNSDSILMDMAKKDSVDSKLQARRDYVENTYNQLEKEFQMAQAELDKVSKDPNAPNSARELRQKKVQDLYQQLQEYEYNASQELQAYQVQLIQPLREKLKKAIAEVAKEKGYAYVIDDAVLWYSLPGDDISAQVRTKLGL